MIKEYFANYFLHESDVAINLAENSVEVLGAASEPGKLLYWILDKQHDRWKD